MKDTAHWAWQEPYLAALREQSSFSLRERLLTAEKAILFRMEVLHDAPDNLPELQALREALNSLYAREPNKSPGPSKIVEDREEYEWGRRNWTKLGAVVAVAVIVSFATGWILARKNFGKEVQSAATASEPNGDTTSSDNLFASVRDVHILDRPPQGLSLPPRDDRAGTSLPNGLSHPIVAETHAQSEADERFLGAASAKGYDTPSVNGQTPESVERSLKRGAEGLSRQPAKKPPPQAPVTLHSQPKEDDNTHHLVLISPKAAPEVPAEAQTTPPPIENQPKAIGAQGTPTVAEQTLPGSVTVSFGTYPSLRVPPELRSEAVGAKLQIGRVVSQVDPIYPADAERQHIEGTVKLRAIVGTDGSVQTIEGVTGPPLLVPAAIGAVRQWRYQPTLFGDQPIETGQDVTVVFRLTKDAASPN